MDLPNGSAIVTEQQRAPPAYGLALMGNEERRLENGEDEGLGWASFSAYLSMIEGK